MTLAFTESASIHSALAVLNVGKTQQCGLWDRQSILETTYLLLHRNVRIIAGPGPYAGASGLYGQVVSRFPSLESAAFHRKLARRKTMFWLARYPRALADAWSVVQGEPTFQRWANVQRELFWVHHVKMHGALFNKEFIPAISRVLGCHEEDLMAAHLGSADISLVQGWSKGRLTSEDAQLVEKAWLLAAMIRGKYHEYLARESRKQLISHPFRESVGLKLRSGASEPVPNSDQYFVRMLIGSALLETSPERRVAVWLDNVDKARNAITSGQIVLPHAALDSDAERHAAHAAMEIGLPGSSAILRRTLDCVAAVGIGLLLATSVAPWAGPVGPLLQQGYAYHRGVTVGDDLDRLIRSTRRRFSRLANDVPGRIERELRWPEAPRVPEH
jgi:hypothetical protein